MTRIEEKSLGAAHKGGTTPVVEVVDHGAAPRRRGLVVMDTPGHDVEQLTGMAAGGCQLIAFPTGRDTPTQSPVVPTVKIATNSDTAERLADHIDVDAGRIANGDATHAEVGWFIYEELLAVASGKPVKAERWGQKDFAPPTPVDEPVTMLLLVLHADDDVGICVQGVSAGTALTAADGRTVTAVVDVPPGHKIARGDLEAATVVHKYGQPIGRTSRPIGAGERVHVHNLDSLRAKGTVR